MKVTELEARVAVVAELHEKLQLEDGGMSP